MNRFEGHIASIEVDGVMSLVTVEVSGNLFLSCILIDTPESAPYLVIGQKVYILFKETEVVIGLEKTSGISLRNKIPAKVSEIKKGTLLSSLALECAAGKMHALISSQAVEELEIKKGTSVMAMIKLNELMLSPR